MEAAAGRPLLRIGELSRRVEVSDHLLRAWESRYGLLHPVRSPGGFRLYSEADKSRIRAMQAYLADGLSAAEAARAALRDAGAADYGRAVAAPAMPAGGELSAELQRALDAFDEPAGRPCSTGCSPTKASAGSAGQPASSWSISGVPLGGG